jgi:hypothetical protein
VSAVPPKDRLERWIDLLLELRAAPRFIRDTGTYQALRHRGMIRGPQHHARLADPGRLLLAAYDLGLAHGPVVGLVT